MVGVVLSSPVVPSIIPDTKPESTTAVENIPQETAKDDVTNVDASSHVVGDFVAGDGVTKGTFLAVSSVPMGRSSRSVNFRNFLCIKAETGSSYREELDEIITHDHGDLTTSADNTEAEASDGTEKKRDKNRRRSRLPWVNASDPVLGESKVSSIFSFASATVGDEGKPMKKLQKKRRPKEGETGKFTVARPGTVMSLGSESDRGAGTLSPPPWTQHTNISQSSLNASDFSRQSHVSSNRSSVDVSRSGTPIDRPHVSGVPTTFDQLMRVENDDDLPTRVVMPAAREDKPRSNSQSSTHSAASSGKGTGNKFGAWLRKKRGYSVSSSTSAGGGSSAVSD